MRERLIPLVRGFMHLWTRSKAQSGEAPSPWPFGDPNEGWIRFSQYLAGFQGVSERVPVGMWITSKEFIFVDSRSSWDLDTDRPRIISVVPRAGLESVGLYRDQGAIGLLSALGIDADIVKLLTQPELGLVLVQISAKDAQGQFQQPVFLLDLGVMPTGQDEDIVDFLCERAQGEALESYVIESAQDRRN
jgi:hypothetical protein